MANFNPYVDVHDSTKVSTKLLKALFFTVKFRHINDKKILIFHSNCFNVFLLKNSTCTKLQSLNSQRSS